MKRQAGPGQSAHADAAGAILRAVGAPLPLHPADPAGPALHTLAAEILALREEVAELRAALAAAEAQADHDALTPLFNRRAFERELRREIAVAQRHGSPLCLVYVDLDRFKLVNDRFGHLTGDDVLLAVADILRRNTRESDIVGRLGGDEFGIVLVQAGLDDARRKAEQLAGLIARIKVVDPDDPAIVPVTLGASCGVALWKPGMAPAALIQRADEAMFTVKAGRDAQG